MCQGKIYHQSLISRRFLVSTATTCRLCFAFEDEVMTHDPIYYIYALDVYVTLVLENILAPLSHPPSAELPSLPCKWCAFSCFRGATLCPSFAAALRPCAGPWSTTWPRCCYVAPSMLPWICGSCRPLELSWVMDKTMRAAPASLLAWHCKGYVNIYIYNISPLI